MQKYCLIAILLLFCFSASGQKVAIGTNVADWANLGTANMEAGLSVGRHFSAMVGGRFNPWTMYSKHHESPMRNNVKNAYLGVRYWPWYVYSGWWFGLKGQYEQFLEGGIWRPIMEEGTAIGAGLSGGYTMMVHKKINLEFGIGFWGGRYTDYSKYQCAECTDLITSGPRNFLKFDNLTLAIVYVF